MIASIPWGTAVVEWFHILAGILWFGGSLWTNLVFVPALNTFPIERQREIGQAYGRYAVPVSRIAGGLTILLGILRGTVVTGARVDSWHALGSTTYGHIWLVALIAAIATFAWGERVISPRVRRLQTDPMFVPGPDGTLSVEASRELDRLKLVAALELLGFLIVFTCMIGLQFV